MGTQVYLKNVRCSYLEVFKARDYKGDGKFYYSVSLLVEPGSENDKKLEEVILESAKETWGKDADKKLKAVRSQKGTDCYRDGDTMTQKEYEDFKILTAKRAAKDGPPDVVHNRKEDGKWLRLTENEGIIYSGCYVNVVVEIWIQNPEHQGVRCTLRSIQFYKDGDAFSGGGKPDADSELPDDDLAVDDDDLIGQ